MKSSVNIIASFGLCLLVSCQRELVYNPFESSENGFLRYLAKIEEVNYSNSVTNSTESSTLIFSNPIFDENGKLQNAYVNFIGREANNSYSYSKDKIIVQSRTRDNEILLFEYTVDNGVITKCEESSNISNNKYDYSYFYDVNKYLTGINVSKEGLSLDIVINWHNGNMMSVKVIYEEGYSSIYSYIYSGNKNYKPAFPSFWTSCYETGSVYGVDEILTGQGYFGKNISKDLISEEYYNGSISRVFEYRIDGEGYICEVLDMTPNKNKVNKKYVLEWR